MGFHHFQMTNDDEFSCGFSGYLAGIQKKTNHRCPVSTVWLIDSWLVVSNMNFIFHNIQLWPFISYKYL